MQTIHKFPVEFHMDLQLPKDAQVLSVQLQNGRPQMWVLLEKTAKKVKRTFTVVGTGWQLRGDTSKYIGTFIDGSLVWHVFEGVVYEA